MWHLNNLVIYRPIAMVIGGVQYPATIFNLDDNQLNELGIYRLTEIHPPLSGTSQKYGSGVDDFGTHTRTYPVIDKSQYELDHEKQAEVFATGITI
jgi:hypothetical protein